MGAKLAKTPLTAVIYASLLTLAWQLIPTSPGLAEASSEFSMPLFGYLMLFVYGLYLSVCIVMMFMNTSWTGIRILLITGIGMICLQWIAPLLGQVMYGTPASVLSRGDTWMFILAGTVCSVLLLILSALLFGLPKPQEKPAEKAALRPVALLIRAVILPIVFMLLFFILGYYLGWRSEAVRACFSEDTAHLGFVATMIEMLLTNVRLVPFSLLLGLVYEALSILFLLQLPKKRLMYMILNTLFFLSGVLLLLIPNPALPDAARYGMLPACAVILAVYGLFSSFLLHTSLKKTQPVLPEPQPVEPARQPPRRPASTPAGRPSTAGGRR